MSAPHRNHVEQRAKGATPARQYVSETHDHKPDAGSRADISPPDFFLGLGLVVDQIDDDVRKELPNYLNRVVTAHRQKAPVALKLACEDLAKFLGGMQAVANAVVKQCCEHNARRPRP